MVKSACPGITLWASVTLEAAVRYLAYDFGPRGIRVNALSAGPLKTLAGSAAGVGEMLTMYQDIAPLCRNITHDEVGEARLPALRLFRWNYRRSPSY